MLLCLSENKYENEGMSYNLRSAVCKTGMDKSADRNEISNDFDKLETLILPIEANLDSLRESIRSLRNHFEEKIKQQQQTINNLLTRIKNIEQRLAFNEHYAYLHERKLDDLEQVSRKVNLKFCGIEVGYNDSPQVLMKILTDEILGVNGVRLNLSDFDRCHRVGPRYKKGNKIYQDVLLKMCSWYARDLIYQNRKSIKFFIKADLTTRRVDLFDFVKKVVLSSPLANDINGDSMAVGRTVSYVLVDKNCKLKVKSKSGTFFTFSSKEEFFSIILWLDTKITSSPQFLEDEDSSETYY